jgi:hypothetical protein
MAVTIKHAKTDTISDWTQSDLDAQIAAGNYPAGTVLANIVLPSDWNNDHTFTGTLGVSNGGTGATTLTGYVKGNGTSAFTASSTVPSTDITGLGTMSTQNSNAISVTGGTMSGVTISDYIATTQKAVANGVASLDGSGTVPVSQLPAAVLGALSYQGTWNASTNTPTLASSTGTKGYYYVVNVAGTTTLNGISDWQIGDWAVYNGSAWQKIDNTDAVTSVNGYTGTVVLTAADVSAVPYTGATAAVDLNAKSLTNISSLGINTTTVPTIKFRAFGDNNSSSRIAMRGYSSDANSSAIRVTKFRGTYAAPQAPQSGDSLGKFELAGYGTTSSDGYPQASFEGVATEAWGASARGTKTLIKVTPNTTTTQATAVTIDQDKSVTLAGALSVTGTTTLATSLSGLAKLTSGVVSTATSGSDYAPATSGSAILYGNGSGGFSSVTIGTGVSFAGGTLSATGSGGTVTSVTGTAPVVSSGGATPAISMAAATGSVNGYLTSTDWTTFNNKGSGSVTSVAALTLGTTGTDLTSTVATGTTTPVITLNVPTASASNRGALSSADWTTFNNKGSGSVTSASVVSANGFAGTVATATTTPAITITTSITGVLKGNGTAISAATSGTDYSAGTSALATGIVKSTTTTGALSIAVSGTDFCAATSGSSVLKGSSGNTTAATAGTDYVAPGTATTFTATQTFNGSSSVLAAVFANAAETTTVSATAATGTIQYDVTTQSVLYYTTNASANFTMNFRGSSGTSLNTAMATGQTVTVVFLNTNGTTAYYNNAVTIDGNSVTPKYQGGSAWTSGNASAIDAYSFTIIKTGSAAFTVLTSQTQFK